MSARIKVYKSYISFEHPLGFSSRWPFLNSDINSVVVKPGYGLRPGCKSMRRKKQNRKRRKKEKLTLHRTGMTF